MQRNRLILITYKTFVDVFYIITAKDTKIKKRYSKQPLKTVF